MSLALCKCGNRRGESPNPYYTIVGWDEDDGITTRLRDLIAKWSRDEENFRVIEYFDSRSEARQYAQENGYPLLPHEA